MFYPSRLAGLARVVYYRHVLKVKWKPSFNIFTKIYSANVNGVQMNFADSPFYDIEYDLLDYLNALPPGSSKCFIDAGSHLGEFAIYISKAVKNSLVIALEPDPANFSKLIRNIRLNNCKNIISLEIGLWSKSGKVSFAPNEGEKSRVVESSSTKIKVKSLDELCQQLKIRCDYVKMDIEGAELEALQGATKCIKTNHPKFIIASYHIRNGSMTKIRVENILKKYYSHVWSSYNSQPVTMAVDK